MFSAFFIEKGVMAIHSASELDNMVRNWIEQGHTKQEICVLQADYMVGWPYVWGATGQDCTVANRERFMNNSRIAPGDKELIRKRCQVLNGSASKCDGCKFYPGNARVRIQDCQGFVKEIVKKVGITMAGGGCTSMWNTASNWTQKGELKDLPNTVCFVFQQYKTTMEHVGLHIGGNIVIHCSGEVKRQTLSQYPWTHWAIPKGLDGDVPMPTQPTIRRGSTGPYVVECQTDLIHLGYDLSPYGADGKYGKKTEDAVKAFQASVGLKSDGICGPNTWEALNKAVGPQPGPTPEKLYMAIIEHLTEAQANAIAAQYPTARITEEGE